MFACDQGYIPSANSVEKHFLNRSKRNEMGKNIPARTNDYTIDQLDVGKSVQDGIECVTVCHLDN